MASQLNRIVNAFKTHIIQFEATQYKNLNKKRKDNTNDN